MTRPLLANPLKKAFTIVVIALYKGLKGVMLDVLRFHLVSNRTFPLVLQ